MTDEFQQGYNPPPVYPPAVYPQVEYPQAEYPQAEYPQAGYSQPGYLQPLPPQLGPYSPLVGRNLVSNETTWSLLAHLSIFALGFIGPIIIMVTEGKKSAYTRFHAVEALNMHLTLLIVQLICIFTFFLILPVVFLICAAVAAYIYGIIGGMAANRGETFRYPLIWRMVK